MKTKNTMQANENTNIGDSKKSQKKILEKPTKPKQDKPLSEMSVEERLQFLNEQEEYERQESAYKASKLKEERKAILDKKKKSVKRINGRAKEKLFRKIMDLLEWTDADEVDGKKFDCVMYDACIDFIVKKLEDSLTPAEFELLSQLQKSEELSTNEDEARRKREANESRKKKASYEVGAKNCSPVNKAVTYDNVDIEIVH